VEPVDRDLRLAERRDQDDPALLVRKEEILGVPARHLRLDVTAFLDREYRRMIDGFMGNTQGVETVEKLLACRWHAPVEARDAAMCKSTESGACNYPAFARYTPLPGGAKPRTS
jgi:hypothetical protein